jgi:hypothetical protein
MTWSRCRVAFRMTALGLLRHRVALVLIIILPILFYALIAITTGDAPIDFLLPSVSDTTLVTASRRREGLVFMGLAAVGFISAFLGFHLISRQADVSRRLLVCGYRAWELVVARLGVLACAVVIVSGFSGILLCTFFIPRHTVGVVIGFVLVGLVYGCYGLLAGSLFTRELEGVLSIVLLANIDVGWLQNPIFYTASEHRDVIHALPAYFPAQVSMIAAFSDFAVARAIAGSILYGGTLLSVAVAIFWGRMHIRTAAKPSPERLPSG